MAHLVIMVMLFPLILLCVCAISNSLCPCSDPEWCKVITTVPDHEVFIFTVRNDTFKMYDWTKVTTMVVFNAFDPNKHFPMLCYAHSKGSRVVKQADFKKVSLLKNATAYRQWIKDEVDLVLKYYLDGINVDFESPLLQEDAPLLNQVMRELAAALKTKNKHYQLSFDYAWSPDCIDDRCYDFKTIGEIVDLAFIMSYDERYHDERSGIKSPCIAWANSAANTTTHGVVKFLEMGIPASKMILGVPWYGYIYNCADIDKENVCRIAPKGESCVLGSQIEYKTIMAGMLQNSTSGRLWDRRAASPYFTIKDPKTGGYRQVWYDDPASLGIKYTIASDLDLRGVGMWEADQLDYSDTPLAAKLRRQMWGALPSKNKIKTPRN